MRIYGKETSKHMENAYRIRAEYAEEWKARLSPEVYEELVEKGVDIQDIVAFAREWDMALQRVLDQVEKKEEEA